MAEPLCLANLFPCENLSLIRRPSPLVMAFVHTDSDRDNRWNYPRRETTSV